jgi:aspartyl/asparaginyl beta-hydroxylase (cupin superfamily)
LLTAKGLESTWDRLGDISAAIDYLNKIKKKVSSALSSSYQRSTHTTPDTSHLVWRVADKIRDEELQVFREKRVGNSKVKGVVDVLATGEAKLKSSSLTAFNKKISAMVKGHVYEDEQDVIPQTQLSMGGSEPSDEMEYSTGYLTYLEGCCLP